MLEILLIIVISKKIAAMQKEKGRGAAGYVVLFIFLWFGGEVFGAIVGAVFCLIRDPNALDQDGFNFVIYIFALIGAAAGATIGYLIAYAIPAVEDRRLRRFEEFDDDDDDDYRKKPRRSRRNDDDDGAFEDARDR